MTVRPISHPEPTTHRCKGSKDNPCPTCGSTTGITKTSDADDDDNNNNITTAVPMIHRHQHHVGAPILSINDPSHTCGSLPCTVCGKTLEPRSSTRPQASFPPQLQRISISYNSQVANSGAPAAAIMTKTVTNPDGGFEGQIAVSFLPRVGSRGAMQEDLSIGWPDLMWGANWSSTTASDA